MLNGQISDWRDVLSGVPQGSVLGPLLLILIYINDINESMGCKILKFADDTKIYNKIRSEEDIANLQSDLCNLVAWSKEWQMHFNVEQDAQLSQRDRAAGCVTVFAKSRRLELGDNILRTL